LLHTDFFDVYLREARPGENGYAGGRCTAWMILSGNGAIAGEDFEPAVEFSAGQTVLLPAALRDLTVTVSEPARCLEIVLPENP
jgi:hypothetical protein